MSRDKKKPTAWRCRSVQQQKDKAEIYNSREWAELRRAKYQANPLCEQCIEDGIKAGVPGGYISPTECIHHIHPIEDSTSMQEMRHWAFMWSNLRSLCRKCHAKVHKDIGSQTTEVVKERRAKRHDRWVEQMQAKFMQTTDGNGDHEPPAPPP